MTIEPKTQATINGLTDTFTVTPELNLTNILEHKIYAENEPAELNIPMNHPETDLSDYRMEDFGGAVNLLSTEHTILNEGDSLCE